MSPIPVWPAFHSTSIRYHCKHYEDGTFWIFFQGYFNIFCLKMFAVHWCLVFLANIIEKMRRMGFSSRFADFCTADIKQQKQCVSVFIQMYYTCNYVHFMRQKYVIGTFAQLGAGSMYNITYVKIGTFLNIVLKDSHLIFIVLTCNALFVVIPSWL